jgi:hypothetical protein
MGAGSLDKPFHHNLKNHWRYRWFREGKMPVAARRLESGTIWVDVAAEKTTGRMVLYARVSSHDQRSDLDRQVARLTSWATSNGHVVGEVVTEVVLTWVCARLYGRRGARNRAMRDHRHQGRTRTAGLMAKMGEIKHAAQMLGVISTTLRQHGWKTASPARIEAVKGDPPDWLIAARDSQRKKCAERRRRRERQSAASRLGITVRVVTERDIAPADVDELLAAPPGWLVDQQQRQRTHIEREATNGLRRELTDALIASVHEVWFQELKRATTDGEVEAINARWAPEVGRAKREARRLVDELSPEQVRALPVIGTVRTHENTRRIERLITKGRARVLAIPVRRNGTRLDASVRVVVQRPQQPAAALPGSRVGVDVGVRRLATIADADGAVLEQVPNPRPLDAALRELRHVSRAWARCTKGS